MTEVEWARLKAHELRALADQNAVAIVPVAAIEQHGPHLPVMVDSRLAGEVGLRAARKAAAAGTPTVILPVIWHGLSEHHMPYGGTVTLDTEAFHLVVRGVVASVVRHGFTKVLILNGHGGNIIASQVSAQDLTLELGVPVVAATYWLEAASRYKDILETQDSVLHACEAETSMMLALEPELVDDSDLAGVKGADGLKFLQAGENSFRWRSLTHVTANGVIGDPTTATAEKGEKLLEAGGAAIADLIRDPNTFLEQNDLRPNAVAGVPFRRG